MVIVFRGTETTKEWVENATLFMEQLDGEPPESGLALLLNRDVGQLSLPMAEIYVGACHDMSAFATRMLQGEGRAYSYIYCLHGTILTVAILNASHW